MTRKVYVIHFASDAQSYISSSRIAHRSLRDARRDSSHYNIHVHVLIKGICKLLLFCLDSKHFFVNDAQFNYNYMYVWLLIKCFVLYVSDRPLCLAAISDIEKENNN